MNKSQLLKEIMREYDRDRTEAVRLKEQRLLEVYSRVPKTKEIDDSLAGISIEITKTILAKKEFSIKNFMEQSLELQKEKAQLIKQEGFSDNYLTNIYKCEKCSDTGFIANERCPCFNQRLISKYYQISSLGSVLEKENFSNFNLSYYSNETIESEGISPKGKMEIIYNTCQKFINDFDDNPSNLFFYGKPGLGKTFMCNCIAKALLDRSYTVLYAAAGRLFKVIEDARFNRSEMVAPQEQVDFFYSAQLLIIDDLGTEFSTITTQSALFDIINSRILLSKPTIISSNLSTKDIEGQYSDRIVSRLLGNYTFCKFLGEDIRMLKKYSFRREC